MKRKQFAVLLLVAALLLSFSPRTLAAPTDTVYVRKHVSLVYDNSGSMNDNKALKWTNASYAAQIFAGLLNDSDTLDITLMNSVRGTKSLSIDLAGDRQKQVDKLREMTATADGGTPLESIWEAEKVLTKKGLLADSQIGDNGINMDEQFWLVLTTDGRFENGTVSQAQLESELEQLLKKYSNLQLVYFAFGNAGDDPDIAAYDLQKSRLTSYSNFTPLYAEKEDEIVATMQSLANRISGRYTVSDGVEFNGTQVTLQVSGETSPIRNIAVLAQRTDTKLLSAVDEDGTSLTVARPANEQYPKNTGNGYTNVPDGTKGAHTALITHPDGKFQPGTVTLTFSEPVNQKDFSLMYEPAVYARLTIQQKDDAGNWVDVPHGQKVRSGQPMRVSYEICEDGTNQPLDAAKLPGVTTDHITCGNQAISKGGEFIAPSGNFNITATVSMMDGAYTVSTTRALQSIALDDYSFKVSAPLTFYPDELATNTTQYIDFTILFEGQPAPADLLADFSVNSGDLQGTIDNPGGGVFRFTPKQDGRQPGDLTVQLCFQGQAVTSQTVTVKELIISYEAKAGDDLTTFSNEVAANTKPIIFTVTRTKGTEVGPLPEEDAGDFRIEAKADDGTVLNGVTTYNAGQLHFVTNDANGQPGEYTVTLYHLDEALASAHISILKYNAQFTAEVFTIGDGNVDLFHLRKNESALAFVIYADGEACTGVQLEGMIGNMVLLEHDCPKSIMKLDLSIGTQDGKAAIIARPTSTAGNSLTAFFQMLGIAPRIFVGNLSSGPMRMTLTVQAEKGTQISGTLNKTYDPGTLILLLIILLILIFLLFVILYLIFINLSKPRIVGGKIYHYKLIASGSDYKVDNRSSEKIKHPLSVNRRPQEILLGGGLRLRAKDSGYIQVPCPATEPAAVIPVEAHSNALEYYYFRISSGDVSALLATLAASPRGNQIPREDVDDVLDVPSLGDGKEPPESAYEFRKAMPSGSLLCHKSENGKILNIWSYEAEN